MTEEELDTLGLYILCVYVYELAGLIVINWLINYLPHPLYSGLGLLTLHTANTLYLILRR